MKTKKAILVGAVILFGAGALSNLQWSMDGYGLLNSSLSQQVLALGENDTTGMDDNKKDDGGTNKKGYKEKKYNGEKRTNTTTITTSTTVGVNIIGVVKGEKTKVVTKMETSYQYLNECVGEGNLENCVSTWDETPMR